MAATKKETHIARERFTLSALAALGLPALVFSILGFYCLHRRPMWRDETATREFAMLSFRDLARAVSHVDLVMAPYYALMHVVALISPHTSAFRFPSLIASILTLLFVSATVRTRWGNAAGFVTGSFLAVNATFLATATTARAYALAAMFLAFALWVPTTRLRHGLVTSLWVFGCCAAVLMQLFSILALPALVISLALATGWRRALRLAVAPVICAVLILAVTHKQSSQVGWISRLGFMDAMHQSGLSVAAMTIWPILLVVALGLIAGILRKQLDGLWLAFLLATVLPPLALWLASQVTNPVFLMRYAVFFLPALAGLIGASTGMLLAVLPGPSLRTGLAIGIALVLGCNFSSKLHDDLQVRWGADSTATLSEALSRHVQVGDVVIYEASHAAGGQIYGWALYGHDTGLQRDLLTQLVKGQGAMLQERKVVSLNPLTTVATTSPAPVTWVVSSSGQGGPQPDLTGCRQQSEIHISHLPVKKLVCSK